MAAGKPFELGLVMAGAVSAGAYTAGVVDFLIAALDRWEAAKREDEARGRPATVPHHDVCLATMTGASAGAIVAAMTAAALFADHRPADDPAQPPAPEHNRLYDCWVRRIDIAKLLGGRDLEHFGEVVSLLDSTVLSEIGELALTLPPRPGPARSYVGDPLTLMLTVSNLRGVPYAFSLFGERERKYGMNAHIDSLRFAISADFANADPGRPVNGMRCLDPAALFDPNRRAQRRLWDELVNAALASGAFPIGLQPRLIERPGTDYQPQRYMPLRQAPGWQEEPWIYRFMAVDGGLMSNEPMTLARSYLAAVGDRAREQSGYRAEGALVLIDPFPNEMGYYRHYVASRSMVAVLSQMFSALKSQARFDAEALELAADPEVFNRFAISPSRLDSSGKAAEPAMASALLGGFGGFLSAAFRHHDFYLGRRNCQAFLARHFALPETNAVFSTDNFPPALREAYYIRDRQGGRREVRVPKAGGGEEMRPMLPVIPLLPPLDKPPAVAPWPTAAAVDLEDLERSVIDRVKRTGTLLIETEMKAMLGPLTSRAAKAVWRSVLAQRVSAAIMRTIGKDLKRLG
jgi:hypothetical protein